MAIPSSQVLASWTKAELISSDWILLQDVCFLAITRRWKGHSEDEAWELLEANIHSVAECLRNDASECHIDGSAPAFEIDNEQNPYVRSLRHDSRTTILEKLRAIDPFKVEELCSQILQALGASSYVTQRTGDGGVDFIGSNLKIVPLALTIPVACNATVIGQTKRYKDGNLISETKVREFVGGAVLKRHQLQSEGTCGPLAPTIFAYWTTSDFEPNAKKFARASGIWYMDGNTFAAYIESLNLTQAVLVPA